MMSIHLDDELQDEIRDFILLTKSTRERSEQQEEFLEKISDSKKQMV